MIRVVLADPPLQLQYVFTWPAYRQRTVLLVTCVFAAGYIIIGNMAGNCLIFGVRTLEAANVPITNSAVRGLAVAAATLACIIHSFSRRGGIYLSNVFALVKVMMLLLIIITGICAWAGAFHTSTYASQNMAVNKAFVDPSSDSYGYTKAFLAVIFAWSGFDQPNYVSRKSLVDKRALMIARFLEKSVDHERRCQLELQSVSELCAFSIFLLTLHM
jgi:amino acid transporter